MKVGVAVNPADHRLLLVWHADALHLEAARVPGRDGHNSDEASASTGSYEVTSLVPDRPQLASPRNESSTPTSPRQGTHDEQGQFCGKSHADDPLPANIFTGLRTQGDIAQLGRTLNRNGEPVGRVCSTAWSPYLRCGVAIARMDDPADGPGTQLGVESHDGTMLRGELCTLPMYDPERLIPRGRLVDIPDRHD
ncbi:MAG: hypothetical protein F4155_06885 [Acidimicrobiales bacterium]|nr:hypothetical protein [Acidimicrobiales bacterium]MYH74508.1 hypothetical protein [Acidimicrobiales bacterium]